MVALEVSKDSTDRTRYRESYSASEPISPSGLILYLPAAPLVSIVETAESKEDLYFVVGGLFSSAASVNPSSVSTFDKSNDRVGIVWDTSLSRKSQSLDTDIQIVKQIASKLGSGAKIDIYPFSNAMGNPASFVMTGNTSTDHSNLERHLKQLSYDGGTDLSALKLTKGPTFEHTTDTYAYYCLFTDGMHNMSTKALPQTIESPVYIFATSPEANSSLLKILARKSGGEYFKLASSTSTDEIRRKVDGLGQPSFSFLSVNADSAIVQEVYPSIPTRVESTFRLCGKLSASVLRSGSPTFLTLNFGFGSKVTHSQSFQLTTQGAAFTSLIPRMWAQRKIDELTLFPEETENEKVILELGRQFSIVTPSTSIIVLEELEQYVKHDIEPPAALQSIRTKWLAIKQERANEQKSKEEEKIISILSLWNRRTAWWNEDRASSEAQERTHIHYLPFGDGVDLTSRALASQWIDWEALNAPHMDDSSSDSSDYSEDDLDDEEQSSGSGSESDASSGTASGSDSGSDSGSGSESSSGSVASITGSFSADLRLERRTKDTDIRSSLRMYRSSSPPPMAREDRDYEEECDDDEAGGFGLFDDEPAAAAAAPPSEEGFLTSPRNFLQADFKSKDKELRSPAEGIMKLKKKKMAAPEKDKEKEKKDMKERKEEKPRLSIGGKGVRSASGPSGSVAEDGKRQSASKGAPRLSAKGPGAPPLAPSRQQMSSFEGEMQLQMQQMPMQLGQQQQQAFFGSVSSSVSASKKSARSGFAAAPRSRSAMPSPAAASLSAMPTSNSSSSFAMPPAPPPSFSAMSDSSPSFGMPPPPPPSFSAMPPPPPPSFSGMMAPPMPGGPPPPPLGGVPSPYGMPGAMAPSGYAAPPQAFGLGMAASKSPSSHFNSISAAPSPAPRSFARSSSIAAPIPPPAPAPAPAAPAPQSARSSLLSNIITGSSLKKAEKRSEAPEQPQRDMLQTLSSALMRRSSVVATDDSDGGISDEEEEDDWDAGEGEESKVADAFDLFMDESEISLEYSAPQSELFMEKVDESQDLFGGLVDALSQRRSSSSSFSQAAPAINESSRRGKGAATRGGRFGSSDRNGDSLMSSVKNGSAMMDRPILPAPATISPITAITPTPTSSKQSMSMREESYMAMEPARPKPAMPTKKPMAPITRNPVRIEEDFNMPSLTPYVAQYVPLEYAYYEAIDPNAPVEYSKDLTPAPEFPPVDWDSITYGSNPSEQSWKRWRARHKEQSWAEYEQKAFGVGTVFMELFNQQRRLILESRIQSDIEAVEAENRKNRPLKNTFFEPERFRVALSKSTTASEEPWILELGINNSASTAYTHYLTMRERPELAKLSKFYIDAADFFFESLNDSKKAATILSNLAELELENPQFLRLIAFRLERAPEDPYLQTAINIYRKVLAIRGEEPQSYRDLAMALSRRALYLSKNLSQLQAGVPTASVGKKTLAESRPSYNRYSLQEEKRIQAEMRGLLEESLKLLNDVVLKKWDVRFAQVEVVVLMDINRVVAIIRSMNLEHVIGIHNFVDPRLYAAHMPVDLRIQIQWDTDMTDLELTVVEPSGEKCNSIHNKTASGGMMSRDFTHGYGPVEYLTRYTEGGCYSASLKLFHSLEMKSGTTALVRVWTDYGRPGLEKEHFFVGRLNKAKQTLSVGNIFVSNAKNITKA